MTIETDLEELEAVLQPLIDALPVHPFYDIVFDKDATRLMWESGDGESVVIGWRGHISWTGEQVRKWRDSNELDQHNNKPTWGRNLAVSELLLSADIEGVMHSVRRLIDRDFNDSLSNVCLRDHGMTLRHDRWVKMPALREATGGMPASGMLA